MSFCTDSEPTVTQYIEGLKVGDQSVSQQTWERFISRLIRLAYQKLRAANQSVAHDEDNVSIVFANIVAQLRQGHLPQWNDRHDLWQVLARQVNLRSHSDWIRLERTSSRMDSTPLDSLSITHITGEVRNGQAARSNIESFPNISPTREMASGLIELFRNRLKLLTNRSYREIALLKMQNLTNREIADRLKLGLRTVERRLEAVRAIWTR